MRHSTLFWIKQKNSLLVIFRRTFPSKIRKIDGKIYQKSQIQVFEEISNYRTNYF